MSAPWDPTRPSFSIRRFDWTWYRHSTITLAPERTDEVAFQHTYQAQVRAGVYSDSDIPPSPTLSFVHSLDMPSKQYEDLLSGPPEYESPPVLSSRTLVPELAAPSPGLPTSPAPAYTVVPYRDEEFRFAPLIRGKLGDIELETRDGERFLVHREVLEREMVFFHI